jgi:hypothetical protein
METDLLKFLLPVSVFFNDMSKDKTTNHEPRTTVSLWGLASGFGLVRILTTRVRAFYERRYKSRHQEPMSRIVFLFDMALVSVIAVLLVIVLSISLQSFSSSSFIVTFESSQFSSAEQTPVTAVITVAKKSGLHRNIRAFWKLPSGVEILESNPMISSDGSIHLGSLNEGGEVRIHLVVRANRPLGDTVTIGLHLQEGGLFDGRSSYASFSKTVDGQGLIAEIPSEVLADHVVARDAVIPIRVVNKTTRTIPLAEIRPTESSNVDFSRQTLGDVLPNEERYVFIPLGDLDTSPVLSWSLIVESREIASGTWKADVMEWPNMPDLQDSFIFESDSTSTIHVSNGSGSDIVIIGSMVNPSVQSLTLAGDSEHIPLFLNASKDPQRIFIAPVRILEDGSRILGSASFGLSAEELPLTTSIRYFSASGDQIGVGANPPILDQETRYWIFFSIDLTKTTLEQIHVRAVLPKGVSFTGAVAIPDGGIWSAVRQTLDWKILSIKKDHTTAMIGAEVSVTPTSNMVSPYELLSSVYAEATDVETGAVLKMKQGNMTTEDVDKKVE